MTLRLSEKEFAERFPEHQEAEDLTGEVEMHEAMLAMEGSYQVADPPSKKAILMRYALVFILGYLAAELRYAVSMFFIF